MESPSFSLYGLQIIFILSLLLLSAFFSAIETCMTVTSKAKMNSLRNNGNKRAEIVMRILSRKSQMVSTVLLCNNAINILASALATSVLVNIFSDQNGVLISTIVMTVLIVIFGEILPKRIALQFPEHLALFFAPFIDKVIFICSPIVALMQCLIQTIQYPIRLMNPNFGSSEKESQIIANELLKEEVELYHDEGNFVKLDKDMVHGLLNLRDISVSEIMTHRKDIESIDLDSDPDELLQKIIGIRHTRIPFYRDTIDNVVGTLHTKDLLKIINKGDRQKVKKSDIEALLVKPWFIAGSTNLKTQLLAFQKKRNHFAFVVDEYGGLMGIVTLEDILEEIVGDIEDEHDEETIEIQQNNDGSFTVNGDYLIRDFNRYFDAALSDEDANTIAGLVMSVMERIPEKGEFCVNSGYRFIILERENQHINLIKIEAIQPEEGDEQE